MKKRISLFSMLLLAALMGAHFNAQAQTDVTSLYLTNADFETSPTGDVTDNYVYDVPGWTETPAAGTQTYYKLGTVAYGHTGGTLGTVPANGSSVSENNTSLVGFKVHWNPGVDICVSQTTTTLPAGEYTLTWDSYVVQTVTRQTSRCGYVIGSGAAVYDALPTAVNTWKNHSQTIILTEANTLTIRMGYNKNADGGGADSPILFVDNVKLTFKSFKEALQTVITEATTVYGGGNGTDAAALNTAITNAQVVYDNATASSSEISTAITTLQQAIRTYQIANASVSAPLDFTDQIANPSFESAFTGWTNTNTMAIQTNNDANISAYKHGTNYAEKWIAAANNLPNAGVSQTVSGLPNGIYRLTAAALALKQSSPVVAGTGVYLYAGTEQVAVGFGNVYNVLAPVTNGSLLIGFKTQSAVANWVACDNFHLYYLGSDIVAPFREALQAQVTAADETYTGEPMHTEVATALAQAIADALVVINNDGATKNDIDNASAALTLATDAAAISVVSYVNADLSTLTVDGTSIAGFAASQNEYIYYVAAGTTTIPTVAYTTSNILATAQIAPATAIGGATTVTVTAESGATKVYTINFAVNYIYGWNNNSDTNTPEDAGWSASPTVTWGHENTLNCSFRTGIGAPINNGTAPMVYNNIENVNLFYPTTALTAGKTYSISGNVWRRNGGAAGKYTLTVGIRTTNDITTGAALLNTVFDSQVGNNTITTFDYPFVSQNASTNYFLFNAVNAVETWQSVGLYNLALVETGDAASATFNSNGGSNVAAQYFLPETSYEVVAPVAPTKDGFEFAGWYTDAELTDAATFPATVTESTVFYAKWTQIIDLTPLKEALQAQVTAADATYTGQPMHTEVATALAQAIADALVVIANADATQNDIETAAAALTSATNAAAISVVSYVNADLSDLTVDGTTIAGFAASQNEYTYYVAASTTTIPTVAYTTSNAQATAQVVPATVAGGATTVTVTAESGATKVYTINFVINYVYGWDNNSGNNTPADAGWSASSTITWGHDNSDECSFRTIGVPVSSTVIYMTLKDVYLSYPTATMTAGKLYKVSGSVWRRNGSSTAQLTTTVGVNSTRDIASDTLINASFDSQVGNGLVSTFESAPFVSQTSADNYFSIKVGNVLGNWENVGFYNLVLVETGDALSATFNSNGGSSVATQYFLPETSYEVVAPVAPTKDGFEFAGWYTDEELTIPATFPVTVTTNTVFYAKWQIPTGVNTVNADNGLSISNIANGINIEAKTAAHVQIFSVIGQLIGTRNLAAGESTFVTLPKGIYVVNGQKVVVK